MPQEIIEADTITPQMNDRIIQIVDPVMFELTRDEPEPAQVSKARERLLGYLTANQPSDAYLRALSKVIADRMDPAVNHKSELIRMNAMIILTRMVDVGSKALIDSGLEDESDAVKHWAMEALGNRMIWWKIQAGRSSAANPQAMRANISDAIRQIAVKLEQKPALHPIVAAAAFEALLNADTARSREVLVEQLNERLALHAADANLSYAAERAAIERFAASSLELVRERDLDSIQGLSRAMYRYAALIVTQLKANRIAEDQRRGAMTMLLQCLQGLAQTTAAAAKKAPPADHDQARTWITNARWDDLQNLLEQDWVTILKDEPFNLNDEALALP